MTAHLSVCGPDNDSQGFALDQVQVTLSETGFLTITGTDPNEQHWRLSIPVEIMATVEVAPSGRDHGKPDT